MAKTLTLHMTWSSGNVIFDDLLLFSLVLEIDKRDVAGIQDVKTNININFVS